MTMDFIPFSYYILYFMKRALNTLIFHFHHVNEPISAGVQKV